MESITHLANWQSIFNHGRHWVIRNVTLAATSNETTMKPLLIRLIEVNATYYNKELCPIVIFAKRFSSYATWICMQKSLLPKAICYTFVWYSRGEVIASRRQQWVYSGNLVMCRFAWLIIYVDICFLSPCNFADGTIAAVLSWHEQTFLEKWYPTKNCH